MKIRRILTAITIFLAVVICGVSTGYAIFYFAPNDKVTTIDDNRIDDIKENYVFSDTENEDSWYDVYFFAQPFSGTVTTSTLPVNNDWNGFWSQEATSAEVQYQPNVDSRYGWRMVRVYRSLTIADVSGVGQIDTTHTDQNDSKTHFNGWSANQQAAFNTYNGDYQNNFDYLNLNISLSTLDQSTDDGSAANDNQIFLFPIFTEGKDNGGTASLKLTDKNSNAYYFLSEQIRNDSLADDSNIYYYNFNNILISEAEDSTRLNQNFILEGDFPNSWDKDDGGDEETNGYFRIVDLNSNSESQLFQMPGLYNVHVYVLHAKWTSPWLSSQSVNNIPTDMIAETDSLADEQPGVIVNEFAGRFRHDSHSSGWNENTNSAFYIVTLVERVYEFKPIGGIAQNNFDYEQASRYFYRGEIGTNRDNTIDGDYFYYTYGLNNVYVGSSSETFKSDVVGSSDNETVHSIFRSNVFTIDFWNTPWILKIEKFEGDELRSIQSYDEDMQHAETISDDGLLQVAKWDPNSNEDVTTLSSEYDYKLSSDLSQDFPDLESGQARRTMLKITRPGYYNFRIQVQFSRTVTSGELTQYVKEIKIAIAPADNSYFVKIYESNPTALDENNFVIEPEQAINSFYYYSNSLAVNSASDFFSDQSLSAPSQSIWDWWLNYKEQQGLSDDVKLKDHVTGKEVTEDFVLEGKNYIFYYR